MTVPFADVGTLLRETAAAVVLPSYRRLAAADVRHKADGTVVTVVDDRAEARLAAGLRALLPGAAVVGEEAADADATVPDLLSGPGPVWVVDPLDGTANFVAGTGPFAMLVALCRAGVAEAAWLYDPPADRLWTAVRGGGAFRDGMPVRVPGTAGVPRSRLRGAVPGRWLPPPLADRLAGAGFGALLPGLRCAGHEYPALVAGAQDFALFWRTKPWDHLAGALLLTEAGGRVAQLDATPYDPRRARPGLLAAASPAIWQEVAAAADITGGAG
ncbi:MAG TPA: inositol monophosphatase family protein [Pilimelia sp.]|nr:inositol monophosphatase family protein [Pilimelia sp.]